MVNTLVRTLRERASIIRQFSLIADTLSEQLESENEADLLERAAAALESVESRGIPPAGERWVRVAFPEMVEELKRGPSRPVTLQIQEREDGELYFIATRHYCQEEGARREGGSWH